MGLSIGQGMVKLGENIRQDKEAEVKAGLQAKKDARQSRQDIIAASQREFTNDIASRGLAIKEKEFKINQKAKAADALQAAEDQENLEKGMEAFENISNAVRSNKGTKITGMTNEALSGGGQERVDIPSNINAFKKIENPTPEITKFISDMEKASKLGATSVGSPKDLFKEVTSQKDRQALWEAVNTIPIEEQTNLTANVMGILAEQDETGVGITTQTAPASAKEQMQTLQQAFLSNPDIKHAPQGMRTELNKLAEASIIDADEEDRQKVKDATAKLDFEKKEIELQNTREEQQHNLSNLNPHADRDFVVGEMPAFPSLSNTEAQARSKEELKEFMINASQNQIQVDNATQMIEIADKLMEEGTFGNMSIAEQASLQGILNGLESQMVGQNRVPITGPGVLTIVDKEMIQEVLGSFKGLWRSKDLGKFNIAFNINRAKLDSYKKRVVRDVEKGYLKFNATKLKTVKGKEKSLSERFTVKTPG